MSKTPRCTIASADTHPSPSRVRGHMSRRASRTSAVGPDGSAGRWLRVANGDGDPSATSESVASAIATAAAAEAVLAARAVLERQAAVSAAARAVADAATAAAKEAAAAVAAAAAAEAVVAARAVLKKQAAVSAAARTVADAAAAAAREVAAAVAASAAAEAELAARTVLKRQAAVLAAARTVIEEAAEAARAVARVVAANAAVVAATEGAAAEARRNETRLMHELLHDELTGLPNRRLLFDRLAHALARANRGGTPVAVLFLDLDGFKAVNDILGHAAGDQLLLGVAQCLQHCVREVDTSARVGGDEFVIVCEDLSHRSDASHVAARVEAALLAGVPVDGEKIPVLVSIGVAISAPGSLAVTLLEDADTAMYEVKAQHRSLPV